MGAYNNSNNHFEYYRSMLKKYMQSQDELSLYEGQQFSHHLLEKHVSPDELLSLHVDALYELCPNMSEKMKNSFDFLLEMMVSYGLSYREHLSLLNRQQQLDSEIEVAASMQQTLLQTETPNTEALDIGVVSKPAKKMSGDYYHFVQDDNGGISVAVADIIGKGIPAALCMSMIKYAMDSVPEERMQPSAILESLNRVVEQNIDDSMFITMFYGIYDPRVHRYYYAGAGHEPGFYYHAASDSFEELKTKGLVLGVSTDAEFEEYEREVKVGDMIVLLSDGVTECRTSEGFIERDEVVAYIRKYLHLPVQEMVNKVYGELEKLQGFELRDDVTLIVLKRKV